jgi:uncharacterized oxidoreductase
MKTVGRTILVVGGTSGIGLGLALRLRDAGNTVIVGGRRVDLLASIVAEHEIEAVPFDVSDPVSIAAGRDAVLDRHPNLDVVVTMAGIMLPENLLDPGFLATAESTIETNLLGTIRTIAAFLPHLIQRKEATIMTVSSGLAFVPLPMTPTYNATKAAIHSFSESLRVQLRETSVGVVEIVPPGVRTSLLGQDEAGTGMPLDEFLDEVMELLAVPDVTEILVSDVQYLRFAEANGVYPEALGMLSGD